MFVSPKVSLWESKVDLLNKEYKMFGESVILIAALCNEISREQFLITDFWSAKMRFI